MQPTDRLHALDAVRAYALLLGVVLHAAAAFLEGFPVPTWFVEPSTGAAVIYYLIHMFRMSAFFLIAGFFARMVVERRGVAAFVKDRGKRIAIPLFLFGPVVLILVPSFDALVGYGVAFGLGWLLHRQMHLLLDLRKLWYVYLAAALVLTVVCLSIAGVTPIWQGPALAGTERLVAIPVPASRRRREPRRRRDETRPSRLLPRRHCPGSGRHSMISTESPGKIAKCG